MAIKTLKGKPGAAGKLFGKSDGKGAASQLLSPGMRSSITPGDPMSRMMNQYGKGHSLLANDSPSGPTDMDAPITPTRAHPGISDMRGGKGGIRKNPRQGGLTGTDQNPTTTPLDD
jgi:hypothetical protein